MMWLRDASCLSDTEREELVMANGFPADWPTIPRLPVVFAKIWNLPKVRQEEMSCALFAPVDQVFGGEYQDGPALFWSAEVGKKIEGWFPGLQRNQIAARVGRNPSHFGAMLNGRRPWTIEMLLATLEEAHRYVATLPEANGIQVGWEHLPPTPIGPTYRRYALMSVMAYTSTTILAPRTLVKQDRARAIFKARGLHRWNFQLLDELLCNHQNDWIDYCRRHNDLVVPLFHDPNLQSLVRECALEASRSLGLPEADRLRLESLPNELSLGYAACREICTVFNTWQEAWKYTTDYVQLRNLR